MTLRAAALVLAIVVAGAIAGAADARSDNRKKPVLFVHDFGHSGPLVTIAFYRGDRHARTGWVTMGGTLATTATAATRMTGTRASATSGTTSHGQSGATIRGAAGGSTSSGTRWAV